MHTQRLTHGGKKKRIDICVSLPMKQKGERYWCIICYYIKGVLRAVKSDLSMKRSVIIIAHRCVLKSLKSAHLSVLIVNLNFWLPTLYRLSTIQAADRIVVMDGGQVVEVGFLSIYFESLNNLPIIHFGSLLPLICLIVMTCTNFLYKTKQSSPRRNPA